MASWARKGLKWSAGLLAALVACVLLACVLVFTVPPIRSAVVTRALAMAQAELPFKLRVERVNRLDPWGVELRGIHLADGKGRDVARLELLALGLAPRSLLDHELHLTHVTVEGLRGSIDPAMFELPDEEPAADEAPSDLTVRVERLSLRDLDAHILTSGRDVRVTVQRLGASGAWGKLPSLVLHDAVLSAAEASGTLVELATTRGRFDARTGGTIRIEGRLAGARLVLDAGLLPLDAGQAWPIRTLALELRGVTRAGLERLGVAQGAGLVAAVDLEAHARTQGRELTLSGKLSAGTSHLTVSAQVVPERARAWLTLSPTRLDQLLDTLPSHEVEGALALTYGLTARPATLEVRTQAVRLDGMTLPDLNLSAELDVPRLVLRSLVLVGHERELTLRGEFHTEQGTGSVELETHELALESIALLAAHKLSGRCNLSLHATLQAQERIEASAHLTLSDLALAANRVARAELDATVAGSLAAPEGKVALRITGLLAGDVKVDQASLLLESAGKSLSARLLAQGADTSFEARLEGTREGRELALDGHGMGRLLGREFALELADFRHADPRLSLGGLHVRYGEQRVSLSGALEQQHVQGKAQVVDVELASWAELLGVPGLSGRVLADLTVDGKVERPSLQGTVVLHTLAYPGVPPLEVHADLRADMGAGEARGAVDVASSAAPLAAHAELDVAFSPRKRSLVQALEQAELSARLSAEAPLGVLTAQLGGELAALEGVVRTQLQAQGTLEAPDANATVEVALIEAPGQKAREFVQVTAHADREQGVLELDARDTVGELLEATASVRWPLGSLRAALEAPDVFRTLPPAQASARLFERRLDALDGVLGKMLRERALSLPIRVGADLRFAGEGDRFTGGLRAQAKGPAQALDVRCAKDSDVQVGMEARVNEQRLDTSLTVRAAGSGTVDLTVGGNVRLEPLLAGDMQGIFPLSLVARGEKLELNRLPGLCALVEGEAGFALSAENLGTGPPAVRLELSLSEVRAPGGAPLSADLLAQAGEAQVSLEGKVGVQGQAAGVLSARVPVRYLDPFKPELVQDAPLSAHFRLARVPVASLLAFSPELGLPGGTLSAELRLAGTARDPRPRGYLELADVSFSLASLAQPINDLDGRIELDHRTLRIVRLSAKDRDGSLRARGELRMTDAAGGQGNLTIVADKFPLRQQGTIVGELSVEAAVQGKLANQRALDVSVDLRSGRLWLTGERGRDVQTLERHPDVRFAEEKRAEPAAVTKPTDTGLELGTLTMKSSRDLWILHKDFSVQVGVDVMLARVAGTPRLTGAAALKRGDLKLLGKTFKIDRGTVTFTGDTPPDPALDLRASFDPPSGQALLVQVSGRASAPELTFSGAASTAGEAVAVLSGVGGAGAESQAQDDAKNFAVGVTAGLLTMTARREFGDWVPMLSVETDESGQLSQARAGFDASELIPPFLERVARGAYVEGVVGQRNDAQSSGVGLGVRLEVALPRDFITSMGYGPGPAWSVDAAWAP